MMKSLGACAFALLVAMAFFKAQAQERPPSRPADEADDLDALLASQEEGSSSSASSPAEDPGAAAAALQTIPVRRDEAQAPARVERASRQIEEIVVTARKRAESLQDAPIVVSALSKEQLERYNVGDMTRIAEMTPQLFVSRGSNGNGGMITMRGIGSSSTASGFDQAVSINVDGIQYSRANVLHQGYFDVGQVEVLKGPQSLFFGKSSSAGVISLMTASPGPEREMALKGGIELEADERFAELVLSGPLTGDFGARLAARFSRIDGYVENPAQASIDAANGSTAPAPDPQWPGEEQTMARLTLGYLADNGLDAKLKLFWVDMENGGSSGGTEMALCEATGSSQLNPGQECRPDWRIGQNGGLPADVAATEPIWNERGGRLYALYSAYSTVLNLDYAFGSHKLASVTGHYAFDNPYMLDPDFTATSVIVGAEHARETALSQELRLASDYGGSLDFLVGAYYQLRRFRFNDNTSRLLPLPQDPASGRYAAWERDSETEGTAWSAFGQLIWQVGDTVEVSAGARYSDEVKDSFSVHNYVHPIAQASLRLKPAGEALRARTHDTNLSPEVTVSWNPGDFMVYGAYKQGFKSGGYNNSAILAMATSVDDVTYEPETVSGFEAGFKSTLLDGSLRLNAAAYSYEFKDLQVNFFDSANINFLVQNAATATTRGVELDFRWLPPIDGLDVHGAASYNRAVYGDFISFCYTGQSQEDGCNMTDDQGRAVQDLGGSVRPVAPRYTLNLGFFYERPLGSRLMLSLSADASYVDRYLLNSLGRDFHQDRYLRPDASIAIGSADGGWSIALIGRNLTNEYIAYDGGDSPLSGQGTGGPESAAVLADQLAVVGRPREVGMQFSMKFGGR